ncbi:2-C-methyl-D-erythritol 4-phosphate cytidylyltransferase [Desulfobotulus sp. H1]|uniref:2-C-methyl-D-erythritol 4-phosphate cytidylyltransferase n=1 Tax=Desulfobotulus pelophilus TaxID=2823377 RepID=A0ABT3NCL5_9BACT|nr:2-C-methyl-D-erythritol 4-phosphate cytidylyltransferase [Desulfobotulus pelophilus]
MSVVAVVVAGGSGVRMGGSVRKQYLLLGGMPLMGHCLRTLDESSEVESMVLVVPEEDMEDIQVRILPKFGLKKKLVLAKGGASRQASVFSGLASVDPKASYILVHDAVRPFLEPHHIRDGLDAAKKYGAASLSTEIVDTLRSKFPHSGSAGPDRDSLLAVQTPQIFRSDLLRRAHEHSLATGCMETDDAGLVAALGYPVVYIQGSRTNLKVTSPEDRILAEALYRVIQGN